MNLGFSLVLVLITVLAANSVGIVASYKPIHNPIFHSLHHIFYFLVIVATLFSIVVSFYFQEIPFFQLMILVPMLLLPFFKKGGRVHRLIGFFSLFCAIIPLLIKYFN